MDNWKLNKIFKFSSIITDFYNDTDNIVFITDNQGKKTEVKPNNIAHLGGNKLENDFVIPNLIVLQYSNRNIYKQPDLREKLYQIILKYTQSIDRGHIIEAISFLDYHYKNSKDKKRFIRFVKYYILQKLWMTDDFREKYTINDNEIQEWIQRKENNRKRIRYLIFLSILILSAVFVGICFCVDKKILFGAIIGAILGQIGKLVDKFLP